VTPTPTVNPNQQPPPGTVLFAGQGVTKRDLNLKIGELETVDEGYTRDTFFSTTVPYFGFFFYATNHGQERLLLRYDPAAVHISDDVGTVYKHQALDVEQYWIEPGATKEFGPRWEEAYMCKHQGNIIDGCLMGRNSLFRGPINPRAKSLFITIDYLEDMKNITWRYDLVPTK